MAKIALVTGAAGGLGRAAVEKLSLEGFRTISCDLRIAQETLADGQATLPVQMDVTDEASVARAFKLAEQEVGPVQVLVCCAGGTLSTADHQPSLRQMPVDDWIRTEALNGRGTFLCVREMLARRHASPVDDARIILTSSAAAQRPAPAVGVAYGAAKAAVIAIARMAATEGAEFGVTTNVITPGGFDTPASAAMTQEQISAKLSKVPLRRLGTPAEFADLVAFLASPASAFINGATIDINGGERMA